MFLIIIIVLVCLICKLLDNMNDGNNPMNVPKNKLFLGYMKFHFKFINKLPEYKSKIAGYIMKYGHLPYFIVLIVLLVSLVVSLHVDFHLHIFKIIFLQKNSYEWISLISTLSVFIFGIYKYAKGRKIVIGTDVIEKENCLKIQFISRCDNVEFVMLVGGIEVYSNDGRIIMFGDTGWHGWDKLNKKFDCYREWISIPANEKIDFTFSSSIIFQMVKIAGKHAIKLKLVNKLDIDNSDLYFSFHYELNHKYLLQSKRISVNSIIENSLTENEREELIKILNKTKKELLE